MQKITNTDPVIILKLTKITDIDMAIGKHMGVQCFMNTLIKGIFLTALDKLIKSNQKSKLTPSHISAILLKDMTGKSIS